MNVLVTGAAGFIGFHVCKHLLEDGHVVIALDNINEYYDINLKHSRLKELGVSKEDVQSNKPASSSVYPNFLFYLQDIVDADKVNSLFENHYFDYVCHLAAQAGVRHSLKKPRDYINVNLLGFFNVIQASHQHKVAHFVYASSSSVYGLREDMPLRESDRTNHPISLYAATKRSNELIAHTYSHLYQLPTTGLRFFTVYGPWGRPDMAPMLFTDAILRDEPIRVFNQGNMVRDFTYIDDIVRGVSLSMLSIPSKNPNWTDKDGPGSSPTAPYRILNIGNSKPIKLMDFVNTLQNALQKEAKVELLEMQAGDVLATFSDISNLQEVTSYSPVTELMTGIASFVYWYKEYYG